MKNSQKGSANIILIALIVILAGVFGYVTLVKKPVSVDQQQSSTTEIKQDATSTTVNTSTSAQIGEIAAWQAHTNNEIGFSFKYPQGWKVEDSLTRNTCCLNTFSSVSPHDSTGDRLKPGVFAAQFQYSEYEPMLSDQDFINRLIKDNQDSVARGEPSGEINKDSISIFKTIEGVKVIKFDTGTGHSLNGVVSEEFGYAIPKSKDFSKVVYIHAEQNPTFEKVLSTFKFIPIVK